MAVELRYDAADLEGVRAVAQQIEEAISNGIAVVVRGWQPSPALDFDLDGVGMVRPTLAQQVVVQGQC